jgi:hypothetical protein
MQRYVHADVIHAKVRSCTCTSTGTFMLRYVYAQVCSCTGTFMHRYFHAVVHS